MYLKAEDCARLQLLHGERLLRNTAPSQPGFLFSLKQTNIGHVSSKHQQHTQGHAKPGSAAQTRLPYGFRGPGRARTRGLRESRPGRTTPRHCPTRRMSPRPLPRRRENSRVGWGSSVALDRGAECSQGHHLLGTEQNSRTHQPRTSRRRRHLTAGQRS